MTLEMESPRIVFADGDRNSVQVRLQIGNLVVSKATIIPRLMRIGRSVVRVDGIGGVETHEQYRHKGYARRVLTEAVNKMKSGDAALSILWGIPNFYHRFGFVSAIPAHIMSLDASVEHETIPDGWIVRPFRWEDVDSLARLHNEFIRNSVGPQLRGDSPPYSPAWNQLREEARHECKVLIDESSTIVAYAWACSSDVWWTDFLPRQDKNSLMLAEVVAADELAADVILGVCVDWAKSKGLSRIDVATPPTGNVAAAGMLLGARFTIQYHRCQEIMIRCLDPYRLLTQMEPELEYRWLHCKDQLDKFSLGIFTDEGNVTVFLDRDGAHIFEGIHDELDGRVFMAQHELARLSLGAYPPSAILSRLDRKLEDKTAEVLERIFPFTGAFVCPPDSL